MPIMQTIVDSVNVNGSDDETTLEHVQRLFELHTEATKRPAITEDQASDIADAFEDWANDFTRDEKFVLLNGWNGSISSMTYAVQSTGGLTRGSLSRGQDALTWIVGLWEDLASELTECSDIALKAANSNYDNRDDIEACEECDNHDAMENGEGCEHCSECGCDPAGEDYNELDEFRVKSDKIAEFGQWLIECFDDNDE